jgi:lipopolysaccharide transport system permease protein
MNRDEPNVIEVDGPGARRNGHAAPPEASTRTVEITPGGNRGFNGVAEFWEYRELLYLLVWRDIKVRYKQTVFGAGWAIMQPLFTMAVFTMVFGGFAKVPSDGLPYPIFAFAGVLPWSYFSQALTRSGTSLVSSSSLISKVYFPRLIIPVAAALAPAVDFLVAFVVLLGMMAFYGIAPTWGALLLPGFILLAMLSALSVSLWLTALNVRYRDVGHIIPFLVQIWMYATPVAYPLSLVPEKWRMLYGLNPMVSVVEGFRWGLLGKDSPDVAVIATSAAMMLVLLVGGILYFKRVERTFADTI